MKTISVISVLLLVALSLSANSDIDSAFESYRKGDHKTAIEILRKTISELDNRKNNSESINLGIPDNYSNKNENDSAFKYNLVTYNIEQMNNENSNATVTLYSLGINYLDKGLTHQAIYYFKNAIESNLDYKEELHIKSGFINLGNAFSNINLADSSIKYYELALDLTNDDDKQGKAFLLGTLGIEYFKNGDYDTAEKYLEQSLPYLNSSLSELDSLYYLTNFIALQLHKGNRSQVSTVENYYKFTKMQNKIYFADANFKLAVYHLSLNEEKKAIKYLNTASELFIETGNIQRAINSTNYLINNYPKLAGQLSYSLEKLINMQTVLYSEALQSEVKLKMESENIAENLRDDLYYSEMSSYLMLLILVSFISIVGAVVIRIKSQKNISRLLHDLYEIRAIRKSTMNNNLGKLSSYIAIRDDIQGVEVIGKLLDDVIHDYNKTNIYLKNELLEKSTKKLK